MDRGGGGGCVFCAGGAGTVRFAGDGVGGLDFCETMGARTTTLAFRALGEKKAMHGGQVENGRCFWKLRQKDHEGGYGKVCNEHTSFTTLEGLSDISNWCGCLWRVAGTNFTGSC
jgi:hypothetical protein